jgi:hypothetical protein
MSRLMLIMDQHPRLRQRIFRVLAAQPDYFGQLLAVHTGAIAPADFRLRGVLALGWRLLAA